MCLCVCLTVFLSLSLSLSLCVCVCVCVCHLMTRKPSYESFVRGVSLLLLDEIDILSSHTQGEEGSSNHTHALTRSLTRSHTLAHSLTYSL